MTTSFIFDLETTSVKSEETTPVQVCIAQMTSEEREGHKRVAPVHRILMNTFCKPHEPIPQEASQVHGITDAKVTYCADYAAVCWQAHILHLTMQPEFLIGFNSKTFDEPIINRCAKVKVFGGAKHIDVLDVAYRFFPELPSHKLGDLYQHFTGRKLTGAHDAAVDVVGTGVLLDTILGKIGKGMGQLYEEMKTPRVYSVMPIGKGQKGKVPQEVSQGWARWMHNNAKNMRPDLKATIDFILDGAR